jgi:hypothetical protein
MLRIQGGQLLLWTEVQFRSAFLCELCLFSAFSAVKVFITANRANSLDPAQSDDKIGGTDKNSPSLIAYAIICAQSQAAGGCLMTHDLHRLRLPSVVLIFIVAISSAAFADGNRDRTQVGNTINVGPGEEVQDATCFGCSVRVRGRVAGDVTVFGGSVVIEQDAEVNGDATIFGGDLRIDKNAKVARDVTVFGGRIRRDPGSTVGGDVTNMGGPGWIFLIFLIPLIFLGLFVALIVWLVRLVTRPRIPAAA